MITEIFQGRLASSIKYPIITDELIISDKFSIKCKYLGEIDNDLHIYSLRTDLKTTNAICEALTFNINSDKRVLEFVEFLKLKYGMRIYVK